MDKNRKKALIITIIFALVIATIAVTYAFLRKTIIGDEKYSITPTNLSLNLDESSSDGITLTNATPMTDDVGIVQTDNTFTFSLVNNGKTNASYTLYLEDAPLDSGEVRINNDFVHYSLTTNDTTSLPSPLYTKGRLGIGNIASGETINFSLKLWIGTNYKEDISGQVFASKLKVEASSGTYKPLVETLLANYTNDASVVEYTEATKEQQNKMFVFSHEAGEQQAGWTAEETTDYRFVGKNASNFVLFNNERWRIVGVFTVEDENGNREKRVKLVKDEPLTNYFTWDGTTEEGENGKNIWGDSQLQKLLNPGYDNEEIGGSLYWNRGSGTCYGDIERYADNGPTVACDFTKNGLSDTAKSLIGDAKWYLSGPDYDSVSAISAYQMERSNTMYNSTEFPRASNWIGRVGLLYVTDYYYAGGGGVDLVEGNPITQQGCLSSSLEDWSSTSYKNCRVNNWFFIQNGHQWTITASPRYSNYVFRIAYNASGQVAVQDHLVKPSVYLKSDIGFNGGDGTTVNPFILR